MKKKFDVENIKSYWVSEAEEALTVSGHLFENKDYSYALFFGHLAVEKILKDHFEKNALKILPKSK